MRSNEIKYNKACLVYYIILLVCPGAAGSSDRDRKQRSELLPVNTSSRDALRVINGLSLQQTPDKGKQGLISE